MANNRARIVIAAAARIWPNGLLPVALSAALAACTQARIASQSEFTRTTGAAWVQTDSSTSDIHKPVKSRTQATSGARVGLASFYDEGTRTASGEKFDPRELTAAHPTLPFGTRLRITNVTNGRSVIVRVNDRGPFIAGRVVDVSRSAAETLDMVGRGTARVKVDVVQ